MKVYDTEKNKLISEIDIDIDDEPRNVILSSFYDGNALVMSEENDDVNKHLFGFISRDGEFKPVDDDVYIYFRLYKNCNTVLTTDEDEENCSIYLKDSTKIFDFKEEDYGIKFSAIQNGAILLNNYETNDTKVIFSDGTMYDVDVQEDAECRQTLFQNGFENTFVDEEGNIYEMGKCIYKNRKYDSTVAMGNEYALGVYENKYEYDYRLINIKNDTELFKLDVCSDEDPWDVGCLGRSAKDKNVYIIDCDGNSVCSLNVKTGEAKEYVDADGTVLSMRLFENSAYGYVFEDDNKLEFNLVDEEGNILFREKNGYYYITYNCIFVTPGDDFGGWNNSYVDYGGAWGMSLGDPDKPEMLLVLPDGETKTLIDSNSEIYKEIKAISDDEDVAYYGEKSCCIAVSDGENMKFLLYELPVNSGNAGFGGGNVVPVVLIVGGAAVLAVICAVIIKKKRAYVEINNDEAKADCEE